MARTTPRSAPTAPKLVLPGTALSVWSLVPHSLNVGFLTLAAILLMAQHPLTTEPMRSFLGSKDRA
jgi:hypothetical protein